MKKEKKLNIDAIQNVIFDMDGTLYQLDGINSGFRNSKLEKTVLKNAVKFIAEKSNSSIKDSLRIMRDGQKDPVGLSNYLSGLYDITRADYFNAVWSIEPLGIIKDFEIPVSVVRVLQKKGKRIFLLTSAPSIWKNKVLEFLGLTDVFEETFTGESFGQKKEIFELLSKSLIPAKTLSIGDQIKTDIEPATTFGFETFLVTDSKSLLSVINKTNK